MNIETSFTILVIVAIVSTVIHLLVSLLKPTGMDLSKVLKHAEKALDTATTAVQTLQTLYGESTETFSKISEAANIAVRNSEMLWKTGMITKDTRYKEAHRYVMDALEFMGIELTPETTSLIDRLIAGMIESGVHDLDK